MYEYRGIISRVIDGDTLDMFIDLGFSIHTKQRIRLSRIDSPEQRTEEGQRATEFVRQFQGCNCTLKTEKLVRTPTRERKCRYGRYLGDVFVEFQGIRTNLNDLIVSRGYGKYVRYR